MVCAIVINAHTHFADIQRIYFQGCLYAIGRGGIWNQPRIVQDYKWLLKRVLWMGRRGRRFCTQVKIRRPCYTRLFKKCYYLYLYTSEHIFKYRFHEATRPRSMPSCVKANCRVPSSALPEYHIIFLFNSLPHCMHIYMWKQNLICQQPSLQQYVTSNDTVQALLYSFCELVAFNFNKLGQSLQ